MRRFGNKLALAIASGLLILSAAQAFGQTPYRYPTPALSPWFNLYNKQSGPIDNYNMYVRPDIQLRNTLQTQQYDIQQQAVGTTNLGQQFSQYQYNESRRLVAPTGGPAGFMNQGHFFGTLGSNGQGGVVGLGTTRFLPGTSQKNWALPPSNTHPIQ